MEARQTRGCKKDKEVDITHESTQGRKHIQLTRLTSGEGMESKYDPLSTIEMTLVKGMKELILLNREVNVGVSCKRFKFFIVINF